MKNRVVLLLLGLFWGVLGAGAQSQSQVIQSMFTTGTKLLASDSQGNLYVSGYFNRELELPIARLDEQRGKYFLLKYSPDLVVQKVWQFSQPFKDLLVKDTSIYILGQFSGTIQLDTLTLHAKGDYETYLAKLNSQGNVQWIRQLSSRQDALAGGLASDSAGNILVSGSFVNNLEIGQTTLNAIELKNIYLAKFNPQGDLQWLRQATGGSNPLTGIFVWGLSTDSEGNVLIAGSVIGRAWFGKTSMVSSQEVFRGEGAAYNNDIFLAKYNAQGELAWAKVIAQNAEVQDIVADTNGCIYLTGHFRGSPNLSKGLGQSTFEDLTLQTTIADNMQPDEKLYLAKYSPLGNLLWVKKAEGKGNSRGISLAFSARKQKVYVSGYFGEELKLGQTHLQKLNQNPKIDIFLASFQPNGAFDWAIAGQGEDSEEVSDCEVDTEGRVYLIGKFKKQMQFGELRLSTAGGNSNGFLIRK
ncbi:MAG: hypothetical protein MUE85_06865 [Microscillaceae bacterium]|nr:hypothetical protein [Microscillaceae bacterium]